MKGKLKKLLLVVLVGIFGFSSLNIVNAISSSGDLPISYEVTGFNVFIFNDKGMTQTQTEASVENIKEIPVEGLRYTTQDEVKSENGYTLVSTKLNVDGGVQAVEKIAEDIATENKDSLKDGNNGKYLITFSVNYKLTLPDNTSVYDSDYHNVFSGDQKLLKEETEANKTHGLDQILVAGIYDANTNTVDWNNQAQYVYNVESGTHTFTSRSYLMPDYDQYLIFTNDKKPGDKEIEDPYHYVMSENYGETYRYMMYMEQLSSPIVDDENNGNNDEGLSPDQNQNNNKPAEDNPSDKDKDQQDKPAEDNNKDKDEQNKPSDNPSDKDDNKQPSDDDNKNDNKPSDVTPVEPSDKDNNNNQKDDNSVKPSDDNNNKDNNTTVVPNNNNNDNNNNNPGASNLASNNSNSSKTTSGKTTLAVPNTADNSNVNLTLSGVLLLASGCGIIKLTKKENSI